MKIKIFITLLLLLLIYSASYIFVRQSYEVIINHWGDKEVIFPDNRVYLYYFYRPLSYVDGAVTGMGFHIGQHR